MDEILLQTQGRISEPTETFAGAVFPNKRLLTHISPIEKPISRVVFGTDWLQCRRFGIFPSRARRKEAFAVLDAAYALGINAFDCARVYFSQRTLGEWLAASGVREEAVLFLKGSSPHLISGRSRLSPEEITRDLRVSLKELGRESADFYLLHYDDVYAPVGPIMERLNQHLRNGEIRALGASNWTVKRLLAAEAYCRERGLVSFQVASPQFSLVEWRRPLWPNAVSISGEGGAEEREWYQKNQMPVLAYSPLARGYLTGGGSRRSRKAGRAFSSPENDRRRERAAALAAKLGTSVSAVAMAWLFKQDVNVFPIIGPKSISQLRETTRFLEIDLSPQDLIELNGNGATRPLGLHKKRRLLEQLAAKHTEKGFLRRRLELMTAIVEENTDLKDCVERVIVNSEFNERTGFKIFRPACRKDLNSINLFFDYLYFGSNKFLSSAMGSL